MKGASVRSEEKRDASSDVRRGVCQDQARFSVQAMDVQVVPVQTRPISGERERERERGDCGTHILNSGRCISESESDWHEAEVNSASSVWLPR